MGGCCTSSGKAAEYAAPLPNMPSGHGSAEQIELPAEHVGDGVPAAEHVDPDVTAVSQPPTPPVGHGASASAAPSTELQFLEPQQEGFPAAAPVAPAAVLGPLPESLANYTRKEDASHLRLGLSLEGMVEFLLRIGFGEPNGIKNGWLFHEFDTKPGYVRRHDLQWLDAIAGQVGPHQLLGGARSWQT